MVKIMVSNSRNSTFILHVHVVNSIMLIINSLMLLSEWSDKSHTYALEFHEKKTYLTKV